MYPWLKYLKHGKYDSTTYPNGYLPV